MSRLKLFVPLVVFVLMAALFLYVLKRDGYNPQDLPSALIDKPLPTFSLTTLEKEEPITDAALRGEVVLLNVWATWCISCRAEHPFLNELSKQGVKIIGINYKDNRVEANRWLEALGNPYARNIFDPEGRLGLDLGVYGAPETFLVDRNGVIRYRHAGVLDEKVWKGKIGPIHASLVAQ